MSKFASLTKPRFSVLHLAAFGLALGITTTVFGHWEDFKAGYRAGYSAASAQPARH